MGTRATLHNSVLLIVGFGWIWITATHLLRSERPNDISRQQTLLLPLGRIFEEVPSECLEGDTLGHLYNCIEEQHHNDSDQVLSKPLVNNVDVLVLDGLRHDALTRTDWGIGKVWESLSSSRLQSGLLVSSYPTVTSAALQSFMSSSFCEHLSLMDFLYGGSVSEDTFMHRLRDGGYRIYLAGDAMISDLYSGRADVDLTRHYFDFNDPLVSDRDVLEAIISWRHLTESFRFYHSLGVDTLSHIYGDLKNDGMRKGFASAELQILCLIACRGLDNLSEALIDTPCKMCALEFQREEAAGDSIVLVFSDHGMTMAGSHSSASLDELEAMWIAKTSYETRWTRTQKDLPMNLQDIAVTISLLLDIPPPAKFVGMVNLNLLPSYLRNDQIFRVLLDIDRRRGKVRGQETVERILGMIRQRENSDADILWFSEALRMDVEEERAAAAIIQVMGSKIYLGITIFVTIGVSIWLCFANRERGGVLWRYLIIPIVVEVFAIIDLASFFDMKLEIFMLSCILVFYCSDFELACLTPLAAMARVACENDKNLRLNIISTEKFSKPFLSTPGSWLSELLWLVSGASLCHGESKVSTAMICCAIALIRSLGVNSFEQSSHELWAVLTFATYAKACRPRLQTKFRRQIADSLFLNVLLSTSGHRRDVNSVDFALDTDIESGSTIAIFKQGAKIIYKWFLKSHVIAQLIGLEDPNLAAASAGLRTVISMLVLAARSTDIQLNTIFVPRFMALVVTFGCLCFAAIPMNAILLLKVGNSL